MSAFLTTGSMEDKVESSWYLAIMLFAAVMALIAVGAYAVSKWRDATEDDTNTASELLTNFREMHSRGDLTDEEFRTIKARLSYEMKDELKNSDNKD